jgi:type IV secretory pathway TrbD component
MNTLPDGYEYPIYRSLTEPILVAGLPRTFALVLWTPGMAIILGLYQLWFLPIQLALHFLFAALTKREPYFFEMFVRALRAHRRLEP